MPEEQLKARVMKGVERSYSVTKCNEDSVRVTTSWTEGSKTFELSAIVSDDGIDRITLFEKGDGRRSKYLSVRLGAEDVKRLARIDGMSFLKDCNVIADNYSRTQE